MRQLFTLLLLAVSMQLLAQSYPITSITISLPANPNANTANWGTGNSLFMISATAKGVNGRVEPSTIESKILVIIKKGGSKMYGAYTSGTAPSANFTTLTKVWNGSNAASLIGKDYTLPPGDYELCVQFFGNGAAGATPLSDEKCKAFTIRGNEQQAYQAPQALMPTNGTVFKEADILKPITFRWTPVIPKPQEPTTYRLKVWQLMQGQNSAQAIRANQPIITKDVDNLTQATVNNIITGPCKPPYLCDFVWNIQALSKDSKPIGGNNGTSEPASFSVANCNVNLTLDLKQIECIKKINDLYIYKVCVSATYTSSNYNLTYTNASSGFKAYAPSYSPSYSITNLSPSLQVQNSGATSTVYYCFEITVPIGQSAIKIGLQGDDKDPGPITCQPGAELDIRLPSCPQECACGHWDDLVIQNAAGIRKIPCGKELDWKCNTAFSFSNTFHCNPDDRTCIAKTNWTVTRDGSPFGSGTGSSATFTPTQNGTYKLILTADCNGKKCDSCKYSIVVKNCKEDTCGCNKDVYAIIGPANLKIRCNEIKTLDYGSTITITPQNICSLANCLSKWQIKVYDAQTGNYITTGSGTGSNSTFAITLNTVAGYKFVLEADCNATKCTCEFLIRTKPKTDICDCNSWGTLNVQNGKETIKYDCNTKKVIIWNCSNPFNFNHSYQCKPNDKNCNAKIVWSVTKDNVLYKTDSSSNTVIGDFIPNGNGTYRLTFNADCGGKKCTPCMYTIMVQNCGTCLADIITNGTFVQGNNPGAMPSGTIQNWLKWYGSPIVNNNPTDGFAEQGFVKLSGNVNMGQAIFQKLTGNNTIVAGKKYKVSVAVRFLASENTTNYAKIRVVAFNDTIITNTNHPAPNTNIAIIGRSGKIKDCGDWSVIELPVWIANKNFGNIAINAFTNSDTASTVFIDDVTICETNDGECDEVPLDASNNPIVPIGFGTTTAGFTCVAEKDEDAYYNGTLQDLYPGYNGTGDIYPTLTNSCTTIGGTVPNEATNFNCDSMLLAAGINLTCQQFEDLINTPYDPIDSLLDSLPTILNIPNNNCFRPGPKNIEKMPFHGRDIIYIHGLQMNHITDRAINYNGAYGNATGTWPSNANEYYNGYYKNVGVANMEPHINHFLRSRGNLNRYIIVVYDCSQSAKVAINAVLTQIREAMVNGTGVQVDASDPRGRTCFGNEFVMISHSTGALVADAALSIANKTKTDLSLRNKWGNIGAISDRCKGRVSIQGAYNGSNLAKIACQTALTLPALFTIVVEAIAQAPLTPPTIASLTNSPFIISRSILVDLVPEVTRLRWGSYINDISIPVFTLSGGHPSAILGPLKYRMHIGFDDGVLSMDCANATNNPLILGPSSYFANPFKVFDMGIPKIRAIEYFLDQKRIIPGLFSSASTRYLSPTGMVQPPSLLLINPQNHFNNHFSFVQSSKEHWFNTTEPGSGNIACDYGRTSPGSATNNEEELVVNDASLYSPTLIDPGIISQMGETKKGEYIEYPWIKIVFRHGFPKPSIYWKRFYIWKRTYHKLIDDCMYDVDYAYKYLFNQ